MPTRALLIAVAATLVLYIIPYGDYVGYPLVLLSTFAHEMGHGVAAILVGGDFLSLEMQADGSGVAYLRVPDARLARVVVSAGGLLGPSVVAAILFSLARRARSSRLVLQLAGFASLASAALVVRGVVGLIVVGVFGAACILLSRRLSRRAAQVALAFIAVQLSLSVFSRADYLFSRTAGSNPSDVAQMAAALWLPYWFWGLTCGVLSLLILGGGLAAFLRGR